MAGTWHLEHRYGLGQRRAVDRFCQMLWPLGPLSKLLKARKEIICLNKKIKLNPFGPQEVAILRDEELYARRLSGASGEYAVTSDRRQQGETRIRG